MRIPSRTIALLGVLGILAFIVVGNGIAHRIRTAAEAPEVRERFLRVSMNDGTPLAVTIYEPRTAETQPVVLLAELPVDAGRAVLAREIARRGWIVAAVDLRGTGGSKTPAENAKGRWVPVDADQSVKDLVELTTWAQQLPGARAQTVVVTGLRAAAPIALQAKGTSDAFSAAAIVLPTVLEESNPLGAPAYRSRPAGVLVIESSIDRLPDAVAGFLIDPTLHLTTTAVSTLGLAQDTETMNQLDAWLRNPSHGS